MLKNTLFMVLFCLGFTSMYGQNLIAERTSPLMPELYQITGTAVFQEYDDGTKTLTLSDNFQTPWGPDVRILLGNSTSTNGTVEIVNLTTISHFSGGMTFDIPSNIDIEQFQFILFFCVQFQQFWASGEFGATTFFETTSCEPSGISGNGVSSFDICSNDASPDLINFSNDLAIAAGDNYAYLITDENEVLQEVVLEGFNDFEGSSNQTQRVYGLSYEGTLSPAIGMNRALTTATDCFIHSNNTDFITVTKNACATEYQCSETITATTNWVTEVNVCPGDGTADEVELRNNVFIPAGDNYAYLFTDENQVVTEVVFEETYNFENSGMDVQRVYGIDYSGTLDVVVGQHRNQTSATGCFIHSGDDIFLTVVKGGAACGVVAVNDPELTALINVYPNPASDQLTIELPEIFVPEQISVTNMLGQTMITRSSNVSDIIQLDVSNLNTGNFILRMEDQDQIINRMITIE